MPKDMRIGARLVTVYVVFVLITALAGMMSDVLIESLAGSLFVIGLAAAITAIIFGLYVKNAVTIPIEEVEEVLSRLAVSDYTQKVTGDYPGTMGELAKHTNDVWFRFTRIQAVLTNLAQGDTSLLEEGKGIGKRSENDQMTPALIASQQAIRDLIDEMRLLTRGAVEGNLRVRGDAQKFTGGYREIIEGMNATLDAVVAPMQEVSAVLRAMAGGDLTVVMQGDYRGDFAAIKEDLNNSIISRRTALKNIYLAAEQVTAGARQVSDAAQELSQGATEQASAIEELSASIEEISTQTRHNAENANHAFELAAVVKEQAARGNEQMREMLRAMDDINESSGNISKIIKVIDEIAFQTNILALNAAVEAARAGQYGRGFAVVAEEVRNLAARSASAAKETTDMIEGSLRTVENGSRTASATAEVLQTITEQVSKAASLVEEISAASNEQASGIAQINQGIMQVSQVVQVNSATSEEGAAASEELLSQAEMLRELVGHFKLE